MESELNREKAKNQKLEAELDKEKKKIKWKQTQKI